MFDKEFMESQFPEVKGHNERRKAQKLADKAKKEIFGIEGKKKKEKRTVSTDGPNISDIYNTAFAEPTSY